MRCSKCGTDNAAGSRFCNQCATSLNKPCPKCASDNAPEAKFCAQCAAPLDRTVPIRAKAEAIEGPTGERRHLTVLFCDLVGSTAISAQLDPEEWRETVADYHRAATDAIERFSGYVAQYLGDGVMALFGWPEAHDNDAERAVRAGLAILDGIAKLNERRARPKLSARIGIASGAVVVGAGVGKEAEVFGDAPNIAARVQTGADADTAMITDATHRLLSGLFVVEDRGEHQLKGIERPVQLYRVIRLSGMRGRFQAATAAGGLTTFVGREDELRSLMNRWDRALEDDGQVVLIIGEAGIGKSRLVQRFHEQITGTPHTWIEAGAGAFFQNTPFFPVIEMLRQSLFAGGLGSSDAIAQLAGVLTHADLDSAAAIPLIAPLLNLPLPSDHPPSTLSPDQQRRRLLATLVEWVIGSARKQPLIIATEDLHWADPSTLELIQLLVEQGATARLLLLYTARPEFHAPWPVRPHHTQINLNRLSASNVRTIVAQVAANIALPDETVATVVERTGGVPLFVEELTRAVLERGGDSANREIPATLHDSLTARLDRLGPAKEIIQIGAVIGSEFSYELLHAVHPVAEEILQGALQSLADAELVYARGIAPDATYTFKHALIQDAAYEALLKTRRRELHQQVVNVLNERFPESVETQPESMAHHCSEAGLAAQAIVYWRKAGKAALARSANAEAIAHLRRGLELVDTLPQSPERVAEELRLQLTINTPLVATKGYTDPEAEQACRRARELCRQVNESPKLFNVLAVLWSIYYNRGEQEAASELAQQMLSLAERIGDARLQLWAHYAIGFTLQAQGNLQSARLHLEQSMALYQPDKSGAYGGVQNPGATGLGMLAHVLYALGYPDQALCRAEEALAMARALAHPFTLAWVLGSIAGIFNRRGDYREVEKFANERIALCTQHGFQSLLPEAAIQCGFALIQSGNPKEGEARIREGLVFRSRVSAEPVGQFERYLAAVALAKIGKIDEAVGITNELISVIERMPRNSNTETDIYRLRGDLLLMDGPSHQEQATGYYQRAIDTARVNRDKIAELQAIARLARLLTSQGRREEARAMLADIYNWFTEGFDTADLQDAKALLDELAG